MMGSEGPAAPETLEWLRCNVPGFDELEERDVRAATDFLLLWSFFELTAQETYASAKGIERFAQRVCEHGAMDINALTPAAAHFKGRYFHEEEFTPAFHELYRHPDRGKPRVESFLRELESSPQDTLAALLLIIYRLRNNFVHGTKMAYGLRGQRKNFLHANSVLMEALRSLKQSQ